MISVEKCGLSEETQSRLCSVFSSYPGIQQVVLYGSRAKGNFKPGSDIDLVIFGVGWGLSDLFQLEQALDELLLPYKVDLSLFHLLDNPALIDHIERVGLVFFQGKL